MKFKLGDTVRKVSGSQWKGKVVGTYSTELTPEGYAVESSTEKGSVQIYPAKALELVTSAVDDAMQRLTDVQQEIEQEPVAWLQMGGPLHDNIVIARTDKPKEWNPEWWRFEPLYPHPPRREWVGLTDEEVKEIIGPWGDTPIKGYTRKLFDQIEAKLKEKNT